MIKIKTKLFIEVIGKFIEKAYLQKDEEDISIIYCIDGEQIGSVNLHFFCFKCKEWALTKGYILNSQIRGYSTGKGNCFIYKDDWTSEFTNYCLQSFFADSEEIAIVKACEWILKQESGCSE